MQSLLWFNYLVIKLCFELWFEISQIESEIFGFHSYLNGIMAQLINNLFSFFVCVGTYSLFFVFFFKFYFIFKLYNIVLVLPNIEMNPPQVYPCSPSWTLLPPPSPYPPSGPSQCTSPKHPASCIEPGLATRFIHDIIHVSMPFSQISPPSPSPTESTRLIYISVSLLLSRTQGYCYHLSKFHI